MIYTISTDLLENIEKDELVYFTDLLMEFTKKCNSYKVTKDNKGLVIDRYANVKENAEYIRLWLDFMAHTPSSFEKINIDLSSTKCCEEFFLKLCEKTKGDKNLIVYSKQNITKATIVGNKLDFNGSELNLFDRDTAKKRISQKSSEININGDYINNSQVAKDGSTINKSKNI